MLGHDHVGGMEAVRGEMMGDHLMGMHLRVPAQGYVPLGSMGTGWVMDTQGFTPVLPYTPPRLAPSPDTQEKEIFISMKNATKDAPLTCLPATELTT